MTYIVPSVKTCATPISQDYITPSTTGKHLRPVHGSKSLMHFFAEFIRESRANLHRFFQLVKINRISQAATLSVVKLIDYSDHLPLRISPIPHRRSSFGQETLPSTLREQFSKLEHMSSELIWKFDEKSRLEISYNASLGEAEVHPHLTHAFLKIIDGRPFLHIRYFDDESTIWQQNSCRASTITVAEITINAQTRRLQALRYFRFRSPKRNKFNRNDALLKLHNLLDSPLLFSGLDPHLITFGLEYSSQSQEILCRFARKSHSALQRLANDFLVHSQLSIVAAILKENIAFTKRGIDRHLEFKTTYQSSTKEKRPSSVLRDQYGRKQLRLRLL